MTDSNTAVTFLPDGNICTPKGFRASGIHCGLRRNKTKKDLALIVSDVTTAAKDFIIDSAYDSVYGARPIKRFIQSRVETLIAKAIIRGSYAEGATLTVDYDGNALTLR